MRRTSMSRTSTWCCPTTPPISTMTLTTSPLRHRPPGRPPSAGTTTTPSRSSREFDRSEGRAPIPRCDSGVENGPADLVSASLVVDHQAAQLRRQLVALPAALTPAGLFRLGWRYGGPSGLDGIRRGTEVVLGHVRDAGGLTGGVGGEPWAAAQRSGSAH